MSIPAEDEVLAEGVLEAVEHHQAGKAIQKAERISRQHPGTRALVPLFTALQRLGDGSGARWKDAERASVEKAVGEAIRVARPSADQLERLAELSRDPSPVVRRYAAWKLGDLGDRSTTALVERLQDPDDTVRIWTVDALGSTSSRDQGRVRPLMDALAALDGALEAATAEAAGTGMAAFEAGQAGRQIGEAMNVIRSVTP
jgi:HEAT repeat protein